MGKVNPWASEAFKMAEARRKEVKGIHAIVEVDPKKKGEVASALRGMGFTYEGAVSDFVFVDLPEPADFERAAKIPGVRIVSTQKTVYPMAFGIDDVFKRVAITKDPLLSSLNWSELNALGVTVKPAAMIPKPLQAVTDIAIEPMKILANPLEGLKLLEDFPISTKADWKLITDTRGLIEAPEDYELKNTKVGVIDSGVNPPPPLPINLSLGFPFKDYVCISLTGEIPADTMGHGSWCTSSAFGKPAPTRFGTFIPISSSPDILHVKVFSAFGPCTSMQIMRAMEMCAESGCKVVNMSFGGALEGSVDEDPECVLARKLYEQYGTNFIVAAGNDGLDWSINSPAASPYVLTVAGVDWKTLATSSYSSRGPQGKWYKDNRDAFNRDHEIYGEAFLKPDIAGIGGDTDSQLIAACTPWYDGLYDYLPDGWDMMTGTSMATALNSGLIALAIDKGLLKNVDDVKAAMKRVSPKTVDNGYGLLKWGNLTTAWLLA